MKKFLCLAVVVLLTAAVVSPLASAQTMFHEKDMLISGGIGIGGYGYYGSATIPFFGMFEMGVAPKISVGGMIGYSGSTEENGFVKASYHYIPICVRGSYHFLEGQKNLDAYAGAGLGYSIVSSSVTYNDPNVNRFGFGSYSASGSYMFVDLHVGGRYFFSPTFAGMAELGYSAVGFVRLGVTYKLR